MINDARLDNSIQKIIDRQESVNNFIVSKIARRLGDIGKLTRSDIKKLEQIAKTNAELLSINKYMRQEFIDQQKMIDNLLSSSGHDMYSDAKRMYKDIVPYEKNTELQKILSAIQTQTNNTFVNLCNTKAVGFLVEDTKTGKLVFKNVGDTYKSVIDGAIQSVQLGTESYGQAVRRSIKQLSDSGLRRVAWGSGYTKRLDAAVRQAVHDGIKALQLEMQKEIAKQINADGWQLSAHPNSAPDHEPIQGHSFTLKEFEKLQSGDDFEDTWGNKFGGLDRVIGQWNCRHWARAVILGKATSYKPETLQKWIDNNAKGYTMKNGKHLSLYECSQYQRKLEEKIRDNKTAQMASELAKQETLTSEYRAKVAQYIKQYKTFSRLCGLAIKKNRISISGYKN